MHLGTCSSEGAIDRGCVGRLQAPDHELKTRGRQTILFHALASHSLTEICLSTHIQEAPRQVCLHSAYAGNFAAVMAPCT